MTPNLECIRSTLEKASWIEGPGASISLDNVSDLLERYVACSWFDYCRATEKWFPFIPYDELIPDSITDDDITSAFLINNWNPDPATGLMTWTGPTEAKV